MKLIKNIKWLFWLLAIMLLTYRVQLLHGQAGGYTGYSGELKWLRVNALHTYFSEQGAESETAGDNDRNVRFSWPGEYGLIQVTMRANGMFLACKDYYDSKVDKTFPYMVTNAGPKPGEYEIRPVYDAVEFKLVGRFDHPTVSVDYLPASNNTEYDKLDSLDENLIADRMLLVKNHSHIGVTVTKKVYVFTQQYHDNYYLYDYVIKNTGILDEEGTQNPQQLKDFWFYLAYRYAMAGESVWTDQATGQNPGWGISDAGWGINTVNEVVGTDPTAPEFNDPNSSLYKLRAHYAWYSPHSERPLTTLEDDWGCPNENEDGRLASAKYVGHMVLHADQSPQNPTDDLYQPRTTQHMSSDSDEMQRATSWYNEPRMNLRYIAISQGHAEKTHAQEIAETGLPANEYPENGYCSVQGFGPYTLNDGDSLHFVIAGGVAGLSREKNREVGGNWLEHYNTTGSPTLIMPDGSETTNHTEYKKAWVWTCKDSMLQTFRRAVQNYESGYNMPLSPPPPAEFTVTSGGDRIRMQWADNATSWPNFNGYVIYRSEGNVLLPTTVYKKLYECNGPNVVHAYDDTSAVRGFDYYYYIQSKDDGSTNDIEPGKPLLSSLFWTLTTQPAYLRRPAGFAIDQVRVVPNPYDIRARMFHYQYDRIAFYGLPPMCKVKIFTERGDMIWEKDHNDGSGDELWNSQTSSGQIVVSGIYILYVEVTEDHYATKDITAPRDITDPHTKKLMISKGDLLFSSGEQMFKKGKSVFRKFVIIR